MEQLYAQCFHLYKTNFPYWFDAEDNKVIAENNRLFETEEPLKLFIRRCFRVPESGETSQRLSATELAEILKSRGYVDKVDPRTISVIGQLMTSMSFRKTMVNKAPGYHVVIIQDSAQQAGTITEVDSDFPDDLNWLYEGTGNN
jgi:hypothetical protein